MSPQNMIGKWALPKGEFRGGLLRIAATGVKSGAPKGLLFGTLVTCSYMRLPKVSQANLTSLDGRDDLREFVLEAF